MRFWHIDHPDYDSDYRYSYINGSLEHPYGLPGVECMCSVWAGSRILTYECPEAFRTHGNIIEGCPIWVEKHRSLQQELLAALSIPGEPFVTLLPGDDFQPCFLDVPSRPRADFLWPSIGSLVVSKRIKDILMEFCPDDFVACPVTLRKIGKREARLPPPMPSTGEPEDIINEVPILSSTSDVGPYFEIIVLKSSGLGPGIVPTGTCHRCKHVSMDTTNWQFRMLPGMWKGDSIFLLAPGQGVVVTDELRRKILQYGPTNVIFEEV